MIRIVAVFVFFGISLLLAAVGGFLVNQELVHVFPVSFALSSFAMGNWNLNALELCVATLVGSFISGLTGFVLLTQASDRK